MEIADEYTLSILETWKAGSSWCYEPRWSRDHVETERVTA